MTSLTSGSISRYITTTLFCLPLFAPYISKVVDALKLKWVISLFLILLVIFMFYKSMDVLVNGMYHSGMYKDFRWQNGSYNLANTVLNTIDDKKDKVLIIENDTEGRISNMGIPGIYVRYYLRNVSVGGQYLSTEDRLKGLIVENDASYLLILNSQELLLSTLNIDNVKIPSLFKVENTEENSINLTKVDI